ncbi:MAG TPA: FtsQ-type POTRA domain-containing protein [Pyrinomonadaceae bacterium]|nr:FtsQ-type POTRA domain-containing protein [Pyrinomonadaceae bacterium]
MNGKAVSQSFGRFGLPLLICCVLICGLAVLGVFGYRTATESDFFKVRSIDVRGNDKTPAEDIRRIVASEVEKPGVWNADLADIRVKIEKFPFVKSASVSRMLPAGIRVDVVERVPAAIVHLKSGDFLIDGEGAILSGAAGNEKDFPFTLYGWDEAKTEKAPADNIARIKLYKKMLDEWKQFDLVSRVKQVDLSDLKEPTAIVEDSGKSIPVMLAKDSLGKSLKTAIEAVAGKGAKVKSVNTGSGYPVLQYLDF